MSTDNLEFMAATALRHISRNETVKTYVQQNPPLYSVLLRAASRFIGGETLPQCLETAQNIQKQGFAITIDYMGESTRDATMVQRFMEEFSHVVQAINAQHLNASLSLDLSHIGLTIDTDLAFRNAYALAQATHQAGMELMISMEGSERTSDIIEIHRRLCKHFDNPTGCATRWCASRGKRGLHADPTVAPLR